MAGLAKIALRPATSDVSRPSRREGDAILGIDLCERLLVIGAPCGGNGGKVDAAHWREYNTRGHVLRPFSAGGELTFSRSISARASASSSSVGPFM